MHDATLSDYTEEDYSFPHGSCVRRVDSLSVPCTEPWARDSKLEIRHPDWRFDGVAVDRKPSSGVVAGHRAQGTGQGSCKGSTPMRTAADRFHAWSSHTESTVPLSLNLTSLHLSLLMSLLHAGGNPVRMLPLRFEVASRLSLQFLVPLRRRSCFRSGRERSPALCTTRGSLFLCWRHLGRYSFSNAAHRISR